ncbi:MAG TPA: transaldolase [Pyrinomonadaceae bacterium]|nr:transaldolase [Pyrinomonadaceae bacterium]
MNPQTQMNANPLVRLAEFGQSPWFDFISRDIIESGELARLVVTDGLKGVTSNPAIFEKAVSSGTAYDAFIRENAASSEDAVDLYEKLAVRDVQDAADVLRGVYDATDGADGFVSLEVSPHLAFDTEKTIAEARRLWQMVDRPNLMVKVPATPEGIPAIEQLIADGININVTLLFSQAAYRDVANAYVAGLKRRNDAGEGLGRVASVASFFVSRIDSLVDKQIEEKLASAEGDEKERLESLRGNVAVANAKLAYQAYLEIFSGAEWEALAAKGARPQRVLWASTGTKNKDYSDVLYIDELIGPDTVNTIPPATWDAFRDHGTVAQTLTEGVDEARQTLADLAAAGISLDAATDQLLAEAVKLFVDPFDKMIAAVETAMNEVKQ